LPEGQLTPHILVEADPALTERLWRGSEIKPFVLSPDIWRNTFKHEATSDGDLYVFRLKAIKLIRVLLRDGNKDCEDSLADLRRFLSDVRRHFGLGGGPLRLAVVGTHTSISNQVVVGYEYDAEDMDYLHDNEFVPCRRRHRQLGGLLGAVLRKLWRVDIIWLTEAFPDLCPRQDASAPEYDRLGATAREALGTIPREFVEEAGLLLKRPAVPLMYMRSPSRPEWEPFVSLDGRPPYSTTDLLIQQFGEASAKQPGLEGVLVKVLAPHLEYSPVDPPLVGDKTLGLARAANVRAILLDRKRGIVRPYDADPSFPPIYRV
jgi:hypothetical protein